MNRISANNPVRRCLFPAGDDDARVDNFANTLQESATRDRIEKMKKWNFDFENEVPLEGTYTWYRVTDDDKWLGIKSDEVIGTNDSKDEEYLPMKLENEVTPNIKTKADLKAKLTRKRKLNVLRNKDQNVTRRRIDF